MHKGTVSASRKRKVKKSASGDQAKKRRAVRSPLEAQSRPTPQENGGTSKRHLFCTSFAAYAYFLIDAAFVFLARVLTLTWTSGLSERQQIALALEESKRTAAAELVHKRQSSKKARTVNCLPFTAHLA